MTRNMRASLIDLRDAEAIRERRPVTIAHRGGVITPNSPENSLAALRAAANSGYDMVELDVVKPRDDEPVLFHDGSGNLLRNCGIDARIAERTASELTAVRYRASQECIATLAQALALCAQHRLGVMLDIKEMGESEIARDFVVRIRELLEEHGLTTAAVTISFHPLVRDVLSEHVLFRVTNDDVERARQAREPMLRGGFWFDLPEHLPNAAVSVLQQAGALVLPAVNSFRYPPHGHEALAREDIERLRAAQVDGFQIDSIYGRHLGLSSK